MRIDGRHMNQRELLIRLKELLAESCGAEVGIEVILTTIDDAGRVKAFISMSGCDTEVVRQDGCFIVRVSGRACCV